MSRSDIVRRARLVLSRALICNPTRIADSTELERDLGADDGDMADVKAAVEAEFGIRLTQREIAFCQTAGTLFDLIETKIENRRVG